MTIPVQRRQYKEERGSPIHGRSPQSGNIKLGWVGLVGWVGQLGWGLGKLILCACCVRLHSQKVSLQVRQSGFLLFRSVTCKSLSESFQSSLGPGPIEDRVLRWAWDRFSPQTGAYEGTTVASPQKYTAECPPLPGAGQGLQQLKSVQKVI